MPGKSPDSSLEKPAWAAAILQRAGHCLGLGLICLLPACDRAASDPSLVLPPTAITASEIEQVQRIHILAGDCAEILRANLSGHGFDIVGNQPVGAVIELKLRQLRPLRESLPVVESLGAQAKYEARLIGANAQILLSLYGQEGSLSLAELCDDIGDEIANKLAEYLP